MIDRKLSMKKNCVDIFSVVRRNDIFSLRYLLEEGEVCPDERDSRGCTALHICATIGSFECAELLLQRHCELNLQDFESGYTPLHRAFYHDQHRIALLLLKYGAKLALKDKSYCQKRHENEFPQDFRGCRTIRSVDSWTSPVDHEGLSPFDLLTIKCKERVSNPELCSYNEVLAFGKADFFLGIVLPKAADDVTKPRPVTTLASLSIDSIASSKYHSAAVTTDGKLYTWGLGKSGRLGHGSESAQPLPTLCASLSKCHVSRISCSDTHMLAVVDDGALFSWGGNRFGQLGHGGRSNDCFKPRRVDKLRRHLVQGIAAGPSHSVCFTSSGEIFAWGCNKHGQLGNKITSTNNGKLGGPGSFIPVKMSWQHDNLTEVLEVCATQGSTLVLRRGKPLPYHSVSRGSGVNEVYQWGNGSYTPTRVQFHTGMQCHRVETRTLQEKFDIGECRGPINIISISVGSNHCVGVEASGLVYTWGLGAAQLGHGISSAAHLSFPQVVKALSHENIVFASAAGDRTSAVTAKGDIYTWGSSGMVGALGHGKRTYQPLPRIVSGIKGATKISTGTDHTLVLVSPRYPPFLSKIPTMNEFAANVDAGSCIDESCSDEWRLPNYKVPSLQAICEELIARYVHTRNVVAILAFAEFYSRLNLFDYCLEFISSNFDIILAQYLLTNSAYSVNAAVSKFYCDEVDFLVYCFDDPFHQKVSKNNKSSADEDTMPLLSDSWITIGDCDLPCSMMNVRKMLKSTRKKLVAISLLEEKDPLILSTDERIKLDKKKYFVHQYKQLQELKTSFLSPEIDKQVSPKVERQEQAPNISELTLNSVAKSITIENDISARNENVSARKIWTKKKAKFRPLENDEFSMKKSIDHCNPPATCPWNIVEGGPHTIANIHQVNRDASREIISTKAKRIPKKSKGKKLSLNEFLSATHSLKQISPKEIESHSTKVCPWVSQTDQSSSVGKTMRPPKVSFCQILDEEEGERNGSALKSLQGNSNPWLLDRRAFRSDSFEEVVRKELEEQENIKKRAEEAEELHQALKAVNLLEKGEKELTRKRKSDKGHIRRRKHDRK